MNLFFTLEAFVKFDFRFNSFSQIAVECWQVKKDSLFHPTFQINIPTTCIVYGLFIVHTNVLILCFFVLLCNKMKSIMSTFTKVHSRIRHCCWRKLTEWKENICTRSLLTDGFGWNSQQTWLMRRMDSRLFGDYMNQEIKGSWIIIIYFKTIFFLSE